MSDSLSGGFRSLWPSSTLARLMTIGIPLAAIITFVVVAPGYRGHAPAGPALTPPSQVASAPAVAAVEERNARRLSDLQDLGDALEGFVRQNPAYPSTGGGLQSLCTYETLDAGCALKKLRLDIPADPLGKNSGYWYLSDGSTFTVVSQWEGAGSPPDEYSCPPRVLALKRDSKLVCSSGPN